MTDITPLVPPPPQRRKGDHLNVGRILLGLPFVLGGGYFLYLEEIHPPGHTAHVFLFAGLAVVGAAIIDLDPVISALGRVSKTALQFLPSRQTPAPPAP